MEYEEKRKNASQIAVEIGYCPNTVINFLNRYNMHIRNNVKDITNIRFGKLIPIQCLETHKYGNKIWLCRCDCGNIVKKLGGSLISRHVKDCGYCNAPKIGDKFGRLKIIKVITNKRGRGCSVIAKCDCGNIWRGQSARLTGKNVTIKSCGCYKKEMFGYHLLNQRFGKITVIKSMGIDKHRKKIWLCKCDCGRFTQANSSQLVSHKKTNCGNHFPCRNGKYTSHIALQLHEMLGNLGEHNGWIGKDNCDIVLPNKIVIEYDGWKWHKHTKIKDKNKQKRIINRGYKILIIKSRRNLPSQQILDQKLFELIMTHAKQRTIILSDWAKGNNT